MRTSGIGRSARTTGTASGMGSVNPAVAVDTPNRPTVTWTARRRPVHRDHWPGDHDRFRPREDSGTGRTATLAERPMATPMVRVSLPVTERHGTCQHCDVKTTWGAPL